MSLLTTAIDYTNGRPHIGHAYEKVLTDALARYQRLKGKDTYFLTGVDQHGQKVQQSAQKQGIEPQEFVDGITSQFLSLWDKLGISYDAWAATTDQLHKSCVQGILQKLWEEGWFYKSQQTGFYSVRQEQFVTDKERGPEGEFGSEWGEVIEIAEENYYFKLAEHRDWLLNLIDTRLAAGNPLVLPEFRNAELRHAVEKLSGDLCISRPKERLSWGIEFPFDPDFVTYVWFDALTNYISFSGYESTSPEWSDDFKSRWPALHVIGKDILVPPHGVYWPIMLKALGFPDDQIPTLLVHGWWNIDGSKMSKSAGNVIDPFELIELYGVDATRYYLLSDISTGRDADFNNERLLLRYNTELANSIGNLLNRSLSMAKRYRDSKVRKLSEPGVSNFISKKVSEYGAAMDTYQVHTAISAINDIAVRCNTYVEEQAPWKLAKDPEAAERLDTVLYTLAESLRILSILLEPIIPQAAAKIREQLCWDEAPRINALQWGGITDAHTLGKPEPVFPRLETPAAE